MSRKGGLGKGLDALIPSSSPVSIAQGASYVPVDHIIPNPQQPRNEIDEDSLHELADSIREHGVLQPLIVSPGADADEYILIAGERRLRASRLAGLEVVPVVVRTTTEQERLELALIENVQRADLSSLETAVAYRRLSDEFNLTHDEIAARVGKSRVTVTNSLRLLKLPETVLQALAGGKITEGHGRALLGLSSPQAQIGALGTILRNGLNVRQTEELVRKLSGEKSPRPPQKEIAPEVRALEERLRDSLGTRVTMRHGKKGGTLTIHYYSSEELEAILAQILKE